MLARFPAALACNVSVFNLHKEQVSAAAAAVVVGATGGARQKVCNTKRSECAFCVKRAVLVDCLRRCRRRWRCRCQWMMAANNGEWLMVGNVIS